MTFRDGHFQVDIATANACMGSALGTADTNLLLVSTVFGDYVGPGDCHSLAGPMRALPSDEVLFNLAREVGAEAILFGSASSGPIEEIHESDVSLYDKLKAAIRRNNLEMVDLILVGSGDLFRLMSASPLQGRSDFFELD